jgi:predicted nucleic acid-binding Zn ribbon protein
MQRAGRLIGKLKLSRGAADGETRACAAWSLAAGKKIAEYTRPVNLVRGTLVVEVADAVWQRQLNTLRYFLLNNLEKALGELLVTEIDFRPSMPSRRPTQMAAEPRRSEPRRQSGQGPANGIEDPVLAFLYEQSKKKGVA